MTKYTVDYIPKRSNSQQTNSEGNEIPESNDPLDFMSPVPQEEKDETKLEKILTLNKEENGVKEKVAEVIIDIDGVAKITYPERYNRADISDISDILEYIKHANSYYRQNEYNTSEYDEDYAKDGRDDYTAIFSMALNAIVSKNCVVPDVLYCPKPINTLEGESIVENFTATKNNETITNFQRRISRHIFESVDKVRKSRNKSRFIFVPYRIEICNNKREYAHELLLAFDTSKQQGENGYVKYFDSSHFTQTVPGNKITTFFPNPPFPESFGIKENNSISNDLINKDEVFQKEEGSMSCTYWLKLLC